MKLEQGKKYDLVYSGMFCHIANREGLGYMSDYVDKIKKYNPYIFVGQVETLSGMRNIFISSGLKETVYIMYDVQDVEDYATPYKKLKVSMREIAEKFGVSVDDIEISG